MQVDFEKADSLKRKLSGSKRIGVTELARSRDWRDGLASEGCYEIMDRSDTVGFVIAPECAEAMSQVISQMESELEEYRIKEMFDARDDYGEFLAGRELVDAADAFFESNKGQLMEFADGSR